MVNNDNMQWCWILYNKTLCHCQCEMVSLHSWRVHDHESPSFYQPWWHRCPLSAGFYTVSLERIIYHFLIALSSNLWFQKHSTLHPHAQHNWLIQFPLFARAAFTILQILLLNRPALSYYTLPVCVFSFRPVAVSASWPVYSGSSKSCQSADRYVFIVHTIG